MAVTDRRLLTLIACATTRYLAKYDLLDLVEHAELPKGALEKWYEEHRKDDGAG